jgi:hypothetical protein
MCSTLSLLGLLHYPSLVPLVISFDFFPLLVIQKIYMNFYHCEKPHVKKHFAYCSPFQLNTNIKSSITSYHVRLGFSCSTMFVIVDFVKSKEIDFIPCTIVHGWWMKLCKVKCLNSSSRRSSLRCTGHQWRLQLTHNVLKTSAWVLKLDGRQSPTYMARILGHC